MNLACWECTEKAKCFIAEVCYASNKGFPTTEKRKENRRKKQVLIFSWQEKRKNGNGFFDTTHSLGRRKL